jgi:hypothetical protein
LLSNLCIYYIIALSVYCIILQYPPGGSQRLNVNKPSVPYHNSTPPSMESALARSGVKSTPFVCRIRKAFRRYSPCNGVNRGVAELVETHPTLDSGGRLATPESKSGRWRMGETSYDSKNVRNKDPLLLPFAFCPLSMIRPVASSKMGSSIPELRRYSW